MASSSIKSAYWKGFRDATPFIVVIIPFSTLFGVVATAGVDLSRSGGRHSVEIHGVSTGATNDLQDTQEVDIRDVDPVIAITCVYLRHTINGSSVDVDEPVTAVFKCKER